jgi:hypothetical protein
VAGFRVVRVDVVFEIGRSALVYFFFLFLPPFFLLFLAAFFLVDFLAAFFFRIAIVVSSWSEQQPTFRPRDEHSLSHPRKTMQQFCKRKWKVIRRPVF